MIQYIDPSRKPTSAQFTIYVPNSVVEKINLPTGPYRFAIQAFGETTDWNLIMCTLLSLLYVTCWFSPGWLIGVTVPSTKPQQLSRAAPFW